MMDMKEKISLVDDVVQQSCEEGVMVYVTSQGMIHMLNDTAGKIISMLTENSLSCDEITDKFMDIFIDVDRDEVSNDVSQLLRKFMDMGVIKIE